MGNQEVKNIEFKIVTPEETLKFIEFLKGMVQAKSANSHLLGSDGAYFTHNDKECVVVPYSALEKQGNFLLNLVAVNRKQLRDGTIPFAEVKEFLLDAAFKVATDDGSNILHHAVFHQNYRISIELIKKATKEQLLTQGYNSETALHIAIKGGHGKIIDLLLEKGGAELAEIATDDQETALHLAVKILDEASAVKLIKTMSASSLLKKSAHGKNALDLAIKLKMNKVIEEIAKKAPYGEIKLYKDHPVVSAALNNRAKISVGDMAHALQSELPVHKEVVKTGFNIIK